MSVQLATLEAMTGEASRSSIRLAGIVTTAELRAAGRSNARIRASVSTGDLIRLSRGYYATAELAGPLRQFPRGEHLLAAAAAVRALGPTAVASHHTAAQIHGLDLLARPPERLAITRPPGAGSRSAGRGVLVHCAALPAGHVGSRLAVPVTTAARTVIDMARMSSFRQGVAIADSALRQRLTSKRELGTVLSDCRRWRGFVRAAEVVEFADGLAESALESVARVVFRECGLPPPELQVEMAGEDVRYRVDFLWRDYRTIAEVDGQAKYDDRSRFGYERRRDLWLRGAGYEVVHFGWQEITQQPDYVVRALRAAFLRGRRTA